MGVALNQILPLLDRLAPPSLAESWDNVGLQLGNPNASVNKILVCLDILPRVVQEASQCGAQLLISHHPLFYTPVARLDFSSPLGGLVKSIISAELNVYVAHTNLDVAPGGVNDILAQRIGLQNTRVLRPYPKELNKVVVFVPESHAHSVYEAMAEAGAGQIGSYSHCSFWIEGTGTFQPAEDAQPFTGRKGEVNRVSELRIESLVTQDKLPQVMQAIHQAHPYEEVACDIYPVTNWGKACGLGRIGTLPQELTVSEFCVQLKQKLDLPGLRLTGDTETLVSRVVVCSGSGGEVIPLARAAGAQVLITGDIKYHQAREANSRGLAVVDVGHYPSECLVVDEVAAKLRRLLKETHQPVEVITSRVEGDVFCFM